MLIKTDFHGFFQKKSVKIRLHLMKSAFYLNFLSEESVTDYAII